MTGEEDRTVKMLRGDSRNASVVSLSNDESRTAPLKRPTVQMPVYSCRQLAFDRAWTVSPHLI